MNHRITMWKFLQRTCLSSSAELHTNTLPWSCSLGNVIRSNDESLCNYNAVTTATTSTLAMVTTQCQRQWLRPSSKRSYSKFILSPTPAGLSTAPPLCEEKAYELVLALSDSERTCMKMALEKYDAVKLKEGFEGKLAATQWRTRFGRLSKVPPQLSNVDPTGSFCTFPEDWLKKKAEANALPPTSSDLYKIFFVNAVPFVVFGFLDNFCMITAGDSIEHVFGTFMCISTMAAAGLGNTISDVLGIGTAFYVERFCTLMGLKPPDITPIQMEMKASRRSANLGRILGITIGCLLGMFPLLFLHADSETDGKPPSPDVKQPKQKENASSKS